MKDDGYKKLEIYQLARSLAAQLYTVTLQLPITSSTGSEIEVRRSARSVVQDIVDAYQLRSERRDMLQLLDSAKASCEKILGTLQALRETSVLGSEEDYQYLSASYRRLGDLVVKGMETEPDAPDSPFLVREEPAAYRPTVVRPLEGKVVLVTRSEDQSGDLIGLLEKEGAYGISIPMIEITDPDSWDACDKAIINLRKYDGIFFASTNAVRQFIKRMEQVNGEAKAILATRSIFAVGKKTASAIEKYGISETRTPFSYSAADLANSLDEIEVKGKSFLLPKGDLGKDTLASRLRNMHAVVDEVTVYQTAKPEGVKVQQLDSLFEHQEIDVVTFFSPSSVTNFMDLVEPTLISGVPIAVIGPTTAGAAKEAGLSEMILAKQATAESLVDSMKEYFAERSSLTNQH